MPLVFQNILYGYINSLFAIVLGSISAGTILTIESAFNVGFSDLLLGFIIHTTFFLFGSLPFCAIFNAIIGVPIYILSLKFKNQQKLILPTLGLISGMILVIWYFDSLTFSIIGAIYGGLSGYLFWRGATNID
ncbi:hypothetical protein MHM98_13765 [Psychrobium sp. MM17-31]|uniref:hypothetical protein n=1 Tax=Psychrobium sp. MM17-31 TaxID=2917758 RepID=UPI001EF4DF0B|nr:hypothetical protein [Psychrobium sp. MM17-31]MCG7532400.1 hypothetical protein [Psychrobium sp. MM17-31]